MNRLEEAYLMYGMAAASLRLGEIYVDQRLHNYPYPKRTLNQRQRRKRARWA